MKKCVFAGSFDPITKGHEEIIKKALEIFDEVIVALCVNPDKTTTFSVDERIAFLKATCEKYERVKVVYHTGLLVDLLRRENTVYNVRGIRDGKDLEYENSMTKINKSLMPELITLYLPSDENYKDYSSTKVREVIKSKGDVSSLVPEEVAKLIK